MNGHGRRCCVYIILLSLSCPLLLPMWDWLTPFQKAHTLQCIHTKLKGNSRPIQTTELLIHTFCSLHNVSWVNQKMLWFQKVSNPNPRSKHNVRFRLESNGFQTKRFDRLWFYEIIVVRDLRVVELKWKAHFWSERERTFLGMIDNPSHEGFQITSIYKPITIKLSISKQVGASLLACFLGKIFGLNLMTASFFFKEVKTLFGIWYLSLLRVCIHQVPARDQCRSFRFCLYEIENAKIADVQCTDGESTGTRVPFWGKPIKLVCFLFKLTTGWWSIYYFTFF